MGHWNPFILGDKKVDEGKIINQDVSPEVEECTDLMSNFTAGKLSAAFSFSGSLSAQLCETAELGQF